MPESQEYFWDVIDSYGQKSFAQPQRGDIENAPALRFSDGRGFAVDVPLKVANAQDNEFAGLDVSFEILRGGGRDGVYVHYAAW